MLSKQIEFEWLQSSDDGVEIAWAQGAFLVANPSATGSEIKQAVAATRTRSASRSGVDLRLTVALVRDVCILLMVAVLASSIAVDGTAHAHAGTQREMAALLAQEMQIWQEQDESMYLSLMDEEAEKNWRRDQDRSWRRMMTQDVVLPEIELASAELHGEYALVAADLVQLDSVWGTVPYRQYRFYRFADGVWVRTFPRDHFWGEQHVLETPRLRFEFRDWDADVVRSVAGQLETTYASLYETVGLPVPSSEQKLTIEIVARSPRSWAVEEQRLKVPSYISLSAHPDLRADDAFIQSVTSSLVFQVMRDVRQPYGWSYSSLWNGMFPGLHNWLLTDASGQPPLWHHQSQAVFQQRIANGENLRLMDLNYSSLPTERPEEWLWRMKAGELIVEYIVSSHGREQLPIFIRGLNQHNTWHQLVKNVFGMTLEEFEADWYRYLAEDYDISSAPATISNAMPADTKMSD